MNYLLPQRLDRLAREYALGTLHGGARRRFERVLREQAAAQRAVAVWQGHFSTLAAVVPPLAPREAVWAGLEQRLFKGGGQHAAAAAGPARRESGWSALLSALLSGRALGGALGGTLGGVLAGALLCVVVLQQQPQLIGQETYREALPPSYVGLLLDAAGKPTLLASSRRHGKQLTVKMLQPLAIPSGAVAQLWALPKDGSAPFPVGAVPATGSATLPLADSSEKLFANVSRLAVSIEPAAAKAAQAGAKPSGDYLLSGHCVKLW